MNLRLFIPGVLFATVLICSCSTKNKKNYQLTTSVTPVQAGTVSPESGYFDEGDSLELTATPYEHWIFDRWEDDLTGSENPAKLTVKQDLDITAIFTERTYPLNLEILGEGTVSERIIQQKSNEYPDGTIVELTANPAEGWHFIEWDGDLKGSEPKKEITISGETNITAKFATNKVKTFGGFAQDEAHSIYYTNDGGMVLTGRSASGKGDFAGLRRGEYFSFVLKLDASGEKQWIRTFNGSSHYEVGISIIQINDGGYLFTGNAYPNESEFEDKSLGRGDIFVTKLDASGETVWTEYYGGGNFDYARDIIEISDGNLIVAGQTTSNNGDFNNSDGGMDAFLMKLNADGSKEWIELYGGSSNDYFYSVDEIDDNGFIVVGFSESNDGDFENMNKGLDDAIVMKLNSSGDIIWKKLLGGDGLDYANSVLTSSDGGYIITGTAQSSDGDFAGTKGTFFEMFVLKLNSNGQKEWTTIYDGDFSFMTGYSLVETKNNDIVVVGYSNLNTKIYDFLAPEREQILAMKLNSSGTVQWAKLFNGNDEEFGYSIAKTNDGSFLITGGSESTDGIFTGLNKGDRDIFVIKLNEAGELIPFDE